MLKEIFQHSPNLNPYFLLLQRSMNAMKDCISVSTAVSTTMVPILAGVMMDIAFLGMASVVRVRAHPSIQTIVVV